MKGVVFNLLEEVVSAEHGAEVWDELLVAAALDGAYTSLGSYPDEQLYALVAAASNALRSPPDDVVRWFGRRTMPLFAERYPPLFAEHGNSRSFVLGLNDVIHPEVRKLYPGAATPQFAFDASDPNRLVMEYRSRRPLCAFAEGLLHGAADHFGERIAIERPRCVKHGEKHCVLVVSPA
ncbi:MAG: heme NO-binding domain-containing protein [Solirubrobacteraceae bacterium]